MSVGGSSPSPLGGICIVTSRVTHALGLSGGRALFRSAMVIGRIWAASGRDRDISPAQQTLKRRMDFQNKSPPINSRDEAKKELLAWGCKREKARAPCLIWKRNVQISNFAWRR